MNYAKKKKKNVTKFVEFRGKASRRITYQIMVVKIKKAKCTKKWVIKSKIIKIKQILQKK